MTSPRRTSGHRGAAERAQAPAQPPARSHRAEKSKKFKKFEKFREPPQTPANFKKNSQKIFEKKSQQKNLASGPGGPPARELILVEVDLVSDLSVSSLLSAMSDLSDMSLLSDLSVSSPMSDLFRCRHSLGQIGHLGLGGQIRFVRFVRFVGIYFLDKKMPSNPGN